MRVFQFTVPAEKRSWGFEDYLSASFGGYTVTRGEGAWTDPKGKRIVESVLVYTVATDKAEALSVAVADFLGRIGEQAAYFAEVGTAEVITL